MVVRDWQGSPSEQCWPQICWVMVALDQSTNGRWIGGFDSGMPHIKQPGVYLRWGISGIPFPENPKWVGTGILRCFVQKWWGFYLLQTHIPNGKIHQPFGTILIFTFTNPQDLLWGDTNPQDPAKRNYHFAPFAKAQQNLSPNAFAQKKTLAGLWCFRIVSKNHGPKGVALLLVECLVVMQCLSPQGTGWNTGKMEAGQKLHRIRIFSIASLDERVKWQHMGVSKNNGTPKSSILIGFSIINHPFWGTPILGNIHIQPKCDSRLWSVCASRDLWVLHLFRQMYWPAR